jgi:hypothetical protein
VTPQELAEAYLGALGRGDLAALHIVYDTVDVRPIFENETRRPSWHADQSGH